MYMRNCPWTVGPKKACDLLEKIWTRFMIYLGQRFIRLTVNINPNPVHIYIRNRQTNVVHQKNTTCDNGALTTAPISQPIQHYKNKIKYLNLAKKHCNNMQYFFQFDAILQAIGAMLPIYSGLKPLDGRIPLDGLYLVESILEFQTKVRL